MSPTRKARGAATEDTCPQCGHSRGTHIRPEAVWKWQWTCVCRDCQTTWTGTQWERQKHITDNRPGPSDA